MMSHILQGCHQFSILKPQISPMNASSTPVISDQELLQLRKACTILKAFDNTLRQQILFLLHRYQRMKVTDLFIKLRIEQPVVSQHLSVMRQAGLVKTQKEGKFVFYSIDYPRLKKMEEIASRLNQIC
jgi:DNA-binding transcriptional ArsR family regulator